MIKLMLKNLKLLQGTWLMIAFWSAICIYRRSFVMLIIFMAFFSIFYSLLIDDKNKIGDLISSLPVKRSWIVQAHYFSTSFLTLASTSIVVSLTHILNILFPAYFKTTVAFAQIPILFFLFLLPIIFFYPIQYKIGFWLQIDQASFWSIFALVVAVIILMVSFIFFTVLLYGENTLAHLKQLQIYIYPAIAVLFYLSMNMSSKFYQQKDL